MWASLAADGVLFVHLGFIVFAMFGALLALWRAWAALVHVPALAWASYVEWTAGACPLTPVENTLRRLADEEGYAGSFIEHYVVPVVYPPGLGPETQAWLAGGLLLLNLVLYGYVLWRRASANALDRRAGSPR